MAHIRLVERFPSGLNLEASAVASLLSSGSRAHGILSFLHEIAPLEYVSVAEYGGSGPPIQIAGHSLSQPIQDTTTRCFALYRKRFCHKDEATDIAKKLRRADPEDPGTTVLHYDAADLPDAEWRDAIFEPESLTGRLSFLFSYAPDVAIAVNVYRDRKQGLFARDEIDRFAEIAPFVKLALRHASGHRAKHGGSKESPLGGRAATLSDRERQVASRILSGMTSDGIAIDLGVSLSTVVTLRKRLYLKIGVHSRMDLLQALQSD